MGSIETTISNRTKVDRVKDIRMLTEEGTMEYLKRAANLWAKHTGSRHDAGEANHALWRRQCIKGLPKSFQDSLEEVVGLNKLGYSLWVEHVDHHCCRYQVKKDQEEEELKALNKRLLRQQVAKGDEEINKSKAKTKQMPVVHTQVEALKTDTGQAVKDYFEDQAQLLQEIPNTSWTPSPQIQQYSTRGSGGFPRNRAFIRNDICFACGQRGHWSNTCPHQTQSQQQPNESAYYQSGITPYQVESQNQPFPQNFVQRGRGGPPTRGGPLTRGRGPRFSHASQMPTKVWQPEENYQY